MPSSPTLAALVLASLATLTGCPSPSSDAPDGGTCDCSGIPRRFPAPCRCTVDMTIECDDDVDLDPSCTFDCFCGGETPDAGTPYCADIGCADTAFCTSASECWCNASGESVACLPSV